MRPTEWWRRRNFGPYLRSRDETTSTAASEEETWRAWREEVLGPFGSLRALEVAGSSGLTGPRRVWLLARFDSGYRLIRAQLRGDRFILVGDWSAWLPLLLPRTIVPAADGGFVFHLVADAATARLWVEGGGASPALLIDRPGADLRLTRGEGACAADGGWSLPAATGSEE